MSVYKGLFTGVGEMSLAGEEGARAGGQLPSKYVKKVLILRTKVLGTLAHWS